MNEVLKATTGIRSELEWIRSVFEMRLEQYFNEKVLPVNLENGMPEFESLADEYREIIECYEGTTADRFLLGLSLIPHIDPSLLTEVIATGVKESGDFPIIGCVKGKTHRGYLPTGETALFLIAGTDVQKRMDVQKHFSNDHWVFQKQFVSFDAVKKGEPQWSGPLVAHEEFVELVLTGKVSKPVMSSDFPAKYITTDMEWEDLVLNDQVWDQIRDLELWLKHHKTLMDQWGMAKKLRRGYRVLFYGPPGTGKTLTATLLGKYTDLSVFKVDLSLIVSKYIGETEKNLSALFTKAENKNWILFFDEADALFGKRTEQKDAHDRHANQEVAYLLQRVEDYPGLVILASNFKSNIDQAFTRRFQSMIHFPMPKKEERLQLWQKAFPSQIQLSDDIDLQEIASNYELSGANIMNIVQYCCLQVLEDGVLVISKRLLVKAIRREYEKEGMII